MQTKLNLRRGVAVLTLAAAVPAVADGPAAVGPKPTFAPKGGSSLLFKVTAPVHGHSISFEGDALDPMQIVAGADSGITLNGRFATSSAFSATFGVRAPAEGVQSVILCSVPTTRLKFQLALAA